MKTLMIVDMQKGLINENNNFLIDKINELLSIDIFDKYIYTKFKNHSNTPCSSILGWDGMQEESEQEFAVIKTDKCKTITYSKFTYGLAQHQIDKLIEQQVKEIYLCGTDIDACVLTIGFQLFDNGIKPILLKQYCGTSAKNQNMVENALQVWERSFGKACIEEE